MPPDPSPETDLDPEDWPQARLQAHRMLDDLFDHLESLRTGPVWRPMPATVRESFDALLPMEPSPLKDVHQEFLRQVLPYSTGNLHPGFMGWVHGGGNVAGMLGEMLAGGLNANLGGRDQAPIEVERQILRWVRQLFRFPETASGLFVTGTSMANFMGLLVARHAVLRGNRRGPLKRASWPMPPPPSMAAFRGPWTCLGSDAGPCVSFRWMPKDGCAWTSLKGWSSRTRR